MVVTYHSLSVTQICSNSANDLGMKSAMEHAHA